MLRLCFLSLVIVACTFLAAPAQCALPTDFTDQLVLGSLNQPTAFEFLPDGRILFTEKITGNVRLIVGGVLSPTAVLTLTDLNAVGNERGLLGLAVDPAWPVRPYVYLYYTRTPEGTMKISRYTATGDLSSASSQNLTLGSAYVLLNDLPDENSNHNAGTLRFGPDDMLYASVGEDGLRCLAQDSTVFYGNILRLNVGVLPASGPNPPSKSLLTPPDNPFPPTDPELGLVFCFGLRNPFRFHVDPQSGHLFIGDVGSDFYEELNEASGGENFGWPFREGPFTFDAPPGCTEPGGSGAQTHYVPSIAYYNRSLTAPASVIGGPRYWRVSGGAYSFPPEYQGAVFFAEHYDGFIRVIRNFGGTWSPLPPVPGQPDPVNSATGITSIVDFQVGPDGALYFARLFPGSLRRIIYTGTTTGVAEDVRAGGPRVRVSPNPVPAGAATAALEIEGLATGGRIHVSIVDVTGRRVRELEGVAGEGTQRLLWDGRDDRANLVPGGVYYVTASGAASRAVAKVILLR